MFDKGRTLKKITALKVVILTISLSVFPTIYWIIPIDTWYVVTYVIGIIMICGMLLQYGEKLEKRDGPIIDKTTVL